MNKRIKYIGFLIVIITAFVLYGCSKEPLANGRDTSGVALNMYVGGFGSPSSRVAELENPGNISGGESPTNGSAKQDIGLYIYYQDDYDGGILSKPYVRNMRCEVQGGRIVPSDGQAIYVYDRMTIVAFYPYNADADDYTFQNRIDEKKYHITEGDYSYQAYLPYRAEARTDPTQAFIVTLLFHPVQSYKIQVVLTAGSVDQLPAQTSKTDGVVKLVPDIDPVDATAGDKRENWVDVVEQGFPAPVPASSGQYVRRYSAYIWINEASHPHHGGNPSHSDNVIRKGDILLTSEKLTLFFPEDLTPREGNVYRYGYNITTGEIFIPTSEALIYDAATLAAAGGGGYQLCDIDLADAGPWNPVTLTGTYDGGGHRVRNMKIGPKSVTAPENIGLFGSMAGASLLKNLQLESPEIEVDFSGAGTEDVCNIGSLVGQLNRQLTEAEIDAMVGSLNIPAELPDAVKAALIADARRAARSGTSRIEGCKVTDPVLSATGNNIMAGAFVGSVGGGEQEGEVKDSYVSGGTISINDKDETTRKAYTNVNAGAFCGVLQSGSITNSYTTADAIAYTKDEQPNPDYQPDSGLPNYDPNPTITVAKEVSKGFTNIQTDPLPGLTGNFTGEKKTGDDSRVSEFAGGWPAWGIYGGKWPVANSTLSPYWGTLGSAPGNYPKLTWEENLNVK